MNKLEVDHVRWRGIPSRQRNLLRAQVRFFTEKLKIPAVAVNRETWDRERIPYRAYVSHGDYMHLNSPVDR